jgi:hypothetical protein
LPPQKTKFSDDDISERALEHFSRSKELKFGKQVLVPCFQKADYFGILEEFSDVASRQREIEHVVTVAGKEKKPQEQAPAARCTRAL